MTEADQNLNDSFRDTQAQGSKKYIVRFAVALLFIGLLIAAIYGISRVGGGALGGGVAGGFVGLLVALASKAFEYQKQHEANILEKRKEVYRRLLAPWESLLSHIAAGKTAEALLQQFDRAAYYASCFDAVLYASDEVLVRFVEFRTQEDKPDTLDNLLAFSRVLLAMRKDVTGKKPSIPNELVLKMFVNFKPEELMIVRLREYVANNPEAQRRLADAIAGKKPEIGPKT